MAYSYSRMLFHHKKEWSTERYHSMSQPWKYYAKWKILEHQKTHSLWFHLYEMIIRDKFIDIEYRLVVGGSWGEQKNGEWLLNEYGLFFLGDENILELDGNDGCTTKIH